LIDCLCRCKLCFFILLLFYSAAIIKLYNTQYYSIKVTKIAHRFTIFPAFFFLLSICALKFLYDDIYQLNTHSLLHEVSENEHKTDRKLIGSKHCVLQVKKK